MYEALTSYIEARSKLVEKRKNRGFWSVKGKGKSSRGRGKSFGKRSKDRDALLQCISRSHCRRCGALGHWKAECPQASSSDKPAAPSSSATAHCDRCEASGHFPSLDWCRRSDFRRWVWTSVRRSQSASLSSIMSVGPLNWTWLGRSSMVFQALMCPCPVSRRRPGNARTMRRPAVPIFNPSADRLQGLAHPNLYIAVWKTSVHMPFWTQEPVAALSVTKLFSVSSSPWQNAFDPRFVRQKVRWSSVLATISLWLETSSW